jgi:hypothetical protein
MVGHKLKLKASAKFLSNCISKFVGNVKMQIINATKVILRLDTAMDSWAFSPEERAFGAFSRRRFYAWIPSRGQLRSYTLTSSGCRRVMLSNACSTRMQEIGDERLHHASHGG